MSFKVNVWFEELTDYAKQNVILYITDVNLKENDDNLEYIYEGLFQLLRTVEN